MLSTRDTPTGTLHNSFRQTLITAVSLNQLFPQPLSLGGTGVPFPTGVPDFCAR